MRKLPSGAPLAAFTLALCLAAVAQSRVSLDGSWQFLPDVAERLSPATLPRAGWRAAQVPVSIQAQFSDLRDFKGAAWFRRTFTAPPVKAGNRLLVHFGAADYEARVWLNGRMIGAHEGGYTPFDLDATAAFRAGRNVLLVRIADPPGPPAAFRASYAQIPHGKQNWYVQTSGMWQSVALELKPPAYLQWVHALTEGARLHGFELRLAHPDQLPAGSRATITVTAPDGRAVRRVFPISARPDQELPFDLERAWLWSPSHPRLYRFSVVLSNGDRLDDSFGLRTIAVHDGRIFLNGQPIYLRGALDQAFYPEGIYSPPSLAYLRAEMTEGKRLGLNLLRLHIKTPDPRYLRAADETGMLLWYEIPNWDSLTALSRQRAQALLVAAIARDWNHPSLILQSIINESWGADLKRPGDRAWLLAESDWARRHLPDRLVVDNSPCCDNFHLATDLADFHNYDSIPDDQAAWDAWVRRFAARPRWLFSPFGDARERGDEPLVVSEFGNWGLPDLPARLPWWFKLDFNGNRLTLPAGVFTRMRAAGLTRVFGSYANLAAATQEHEWEALRHEIESLRLQPAIQGYVITEFTDVNWESNGLLTMWRRPKNFAARLAVLQQPVVLMAQADRADYQPGDTARIAAWVSNEAPAVLRGAAAVVAGERRPVAAVASGALAAAGTFTVPIRRAQTGYQTVALELRGAQGALLDRRVLRLAVVAPASSAAAIALDDSVPADLAAALRARHPAAGAAPVLITAQWNARARATAAGGGAVIVLASGAAALPAGARFRIEPRRGNLRGDWISNFNWLDSTRPPFAAFRALGPILGEAARAITPRSVIATPRNGESREVLAGFFLGWVHQARALAVQARVGRGHVVVTTLDLSQYGRDPLATAILNELIGYVKSADCAPRLSLLAEVENHQDAEVAAVEQHQVPGHEGVVVIGRRRRQPAP
ncbi:MAG TPA: hypothetical protein VE996_15250 [Terriglobales bacterium]|nr:hypothetical protein [Terriglobales bacterium]